MLYNIMKKHLMVHNPSWWLNYENEFVVHVLNTT